MSAYGTNFVESEALLAITADDVGTAREILDEMLPGELVALSRHARILSHMAETAARER